jgi:hypothetical protein
MVIWQEGRQHGHIEDIEGDGAPLYFKRRRTTYFRGIPGRLFTLRKSAVSVLDFFLSIIKKEKDTFLKTFLLVKF